MMSFMIQCARYTTWASLGGTAYPRMSRHPDVRVAAPLKPDLGFMISAGASEPFERQGQQGRPNLNKTDNLSSLEHLFSLYLSRNEDVGLPIAAA